MNADKRTVTTDALETLGTILSENEKRDAIHLAVEPVIAAEPLRAGDDVGLLPDGRAGRCSLAKCVGIVDPFLTGGVKVGERFWLIVYPRQITSLRHVWTHPAFDSVPGVPAQEVRPENTTAINAITDIANGLGVSYGSLMDAAERYVQAGEYWVEGGRFEGESIPDHFWMHYAAITGELPKYPGNFLSCSC